MEPVWENVVLLIALILIFEGLLPFVSPRLWKEMFRKLLGMDDGQLRFIGLSSMMIGLILIFVFL
tara:strand:- start:75 stop:269 length:195 start_codon:yes stop_codon:yes gene_type:complete